ncbi:hypothetical protein F4780DRAFT_782754 [Xylariomycetidae sp. FL0641]|nr:hypothetical protein F4780DRAFT_782754 [Xylariomycetidae sp. FL0641]
MAELKDTIKELRKRAQRDPATATQPPRPTGTPSTIKKFGKAPSTKRTFSSNVLAGSPRTPGNASLFSRKRGRPPKRQVDDDDDEFRYIKPPDYPINGLGGVR